MINVVLYRPEKPQNVGNIMRTCVATNSRLHIIGPISFSLDSKDLKRAGLDYIDNLHMTYYDSMDDFLKRHHEEIFYITRYASRVYSSAPFDDKVKDIYVMFGRESTGIPHDILRDHLNHCLRLPMVPEARSLNLSNCVAIVVYEILRQQDFLDLSTSEAIKGADFLLKELNK